MKNKQMLSERKMLKVAALTGGWDAPSARFRVRQYADELVKNNIYLKEYCPYIRQTVRFPGFLNRVRRRYLFPWLLVQTFLNIIGRIPAFIGSRQADLVLINRSVLPGLEESVGLFPRPRILDVDDAIWLSDPRGKKSAARLSRQVDAVIVGNNYLKNWYEKHNSRVYVIPTAVDTDYYKPKPAAVYNNNKSTITTIGWMGTSSNFPNLELVRTAITRILDRLPNTRFLVVSNQRPSGWKFDDKKIVFRHWSAETELRDLHDMDIGLMPLQNNEWTQGKCSFKMLQYLAVGIPVVVSPVGMNVDILNSADVGYMARNDEEWANTLKRLCLDENLRRTLGFQGRSIVEQKYAVNIIGDHLAKILINEKDR